MAFKIPAVLSVAIMILVYDNLGSASKTQGRIISIKGRQGNFFRAYSCLDYLLKGKSKSGIYMLHDLAGKKFPAYCDLSSEPGTAWTLVISWSTKYRALPAFQRAPLNVDTPVNDYAHNWNLYRLSLSRMRSLQKHSTHWRATCSFPTYGVDFIDYVRGTFQDLNVIDYSGAGKCKKVEYINIRGNVGIHQTVPFWQGKATGGKKDFVHIDATHHFTRCEFSGKDNANEDNFGLYVHLNHKFRCTHGNHSTTQWWFGAHI